MLFSREWIGTESNEDEHKDEMVNNYWIIEEIIIYILN